MQMQMQVPPQGPNTGYSYVLYHPNSASISANTSYIPECEPMHSQVPVSFGQYPHVYQYDPMYPNIPYANVTSAGYGSVIANPNTEGSVVPSSLAYGSTIANSAGYNLTAISGATTINSDPSPTAFPNIDDSMKHCPVCHIPFDKFSDLQSHVIVHSNIRPYQCHLCGSACKRRSDWVRHMRKHTADVQKTFFTCKGTYAGFHWGCGQKYSRADARLKHWRGKSGSRCIHQFCLAKLGRGQCLDVTGSHIEEDWKAAAKVAQSVLADYSSRGSTVFVDMSRSATLSQNKNSKGQYQDQNQDQDQDQDYERIQT